LTPSSASPPRASSSRRLEPLRRVDAGVLSVAYYEEGPAEGPAVMLLHGFPYDIHSYVDVASLLTAQGCRVIVPYLRGYGPTRFRDPATPRSGEQASIGADLIALMDALSITRAVFAGYDWGGRAACVGAALWPDRCTGLVSVNGYLIQDIARAMVPAKPEREVPLWYQYYFQLERGRAGLAANRRGIARILWQQWSPNWRFDDACFERTAAAHDNPDYVDVVIHSYRHRFGLAGGDPQLEVVEHRRLVGFVAEADVLGVKLASAGERSWSRGVRDGWWLQCDLLQASGCGRAYAQAPRGGRQRQDAVVGGKQHEHECREQHATERTGMYGWDRDEQQREHPGPGEHSACGGRGG